MKPILIIIILVQSIFMAFQMDEMSDLRLQKDIIKDKLNHDRIRLLSCLDQSCPSKKESK